MASDASPRFCPRCARALGSREAGGRTRLACPDAEGCGFVHWGNPTPVVAALVERGDSVLLVRNVGWPEGWLGLVSGFLEAGESPEGGVLREVREELGLEGELVGLIGVYAFPERNELILAYHVRASGEPVPGAELAQVKAVPVARLRPWPFGTGHAVRDWLAARATP